MRLVKTLLGDNHQIFIEGLKTVLQNDPNYDHEIVGGTPSGQELLELWQEHEPDLLIMDLNLMDKNGLEVISRIRKKYRDSPCILVMTAHREPKILRAILDKGANGFLPKHKGEKELYEAIRNIFEGKIYKAEPAANGGNKLLTEPGGQVAHISEGFIQKHQLTKREAQILQLISQAMSNKEIGRKLFISDQTVSVHRKNIMRKLGVRSTAGLMKMTYEHSF
jgi:two-component system NarL family response regulator